jgi:phosphoribosyl 1,2-cyclic phosphodiesterase
VRIASLGSGSRGNGTLIEDDNTCILVDLGFTLKETIRRLKRLGRSPEDIDAILVTHEHADHINGVPPFARKFSTPVHMTPGTYNPDRQGVMPVLKKINCHRNFRIGGIGIEPVPVPHDAKEPCQYLLSSGGIKIGVLTDLGHVTPFVEMQYQNCDALMLECNHDPGMLAEGPYPYPLKKRVGGLHGHLSNEQAAQLLDKIELGRLQHLVISHISEKNNLPELAHKSLQPALVNWSGDLCIADQQQGFDWIEIN